jgi:hypothetical protein
LKSNKGPCFIFLIILYGSAIAFQSSSLRGAVVVHDGSFEGGGGLKSNKGPRNIFLNFVYGYSNFDVVIEGLLQVHSAEQGVSQECCAKEVSNSSSEAYNLFILLTLLTGVMVVLLCFNLPASAKQLSYSTAPSGEGET